MSHREVDGFADSFAPVNTPLEWRRGTAPESNLPARQLEGLCGQPPSWPKSYEAGL